MMDHRGLLTTELITNIQIHIYSGDQMVFTNTVLQEAAKLIPPNLAPTFVIHSQPQNAVTTIPFSIINQIHVKQKEETFKLIIMLIGMVERRRAEDGGQENNIYQSKCSVTLASVLKQCEAICEVSNVINIEKLNPYWIIFNPILKFRQNQQIEREKRRILSCSQFFKNGEQLNDDYFLYKLNLLEGYLEEVNRSDLSLVGHKFIKICLIGMLKHLKENCQQLYEIVLQQPLLRQINQRKIEALIQLGEFQRLAYQRKDHINGAYGYFTLPEDSERVKQPQEYQMMRERLIRALVKPVTATLTLFILGSILSSS